MRKLAVFALVVGIVAMPALATAEATTEPAKPAEAAVSGGARVFDTNGAAYLGAAIGAGIVIIGGAKGIGSIGGNAVEAIARQPEAAGSISTAMIITAAMIEGATLFAVVVCLLAVLK